MILKHFVITAVDPALRETRFLITANSIESAWRKFCTQHFGALKPDPHLYDVNEEANYETLHGKQ